MNPATAELVERTWREVAGFSPSRARAEMAQAARRQPDLLAFVMGSSVDCRPEVHELAVYLYIVILQIFERASRKPAKAVRSSKIERQLSRNEEMLTRLEGSHARFLEKTALTESSRQPFVVKYLVEALMEPPAEPDGVELSEEETGTLFLILKTVIDLLDEARAEIRAV